MSFYKVSEGVIARRPPWRTTKTQSGMDDRIGQHKVLPEGLRLWMAFVNPRKIKMIEIASLRSQ